MKKAFSGPAVLSVVFGPLGGCEFEACNSIKVFAYVLLRNVLQKAMRIIRFIEYCP